ncbi:glycosyl hydrolase family 95 catalytic domain-containing protein [Foetidibacter luteolus]|uniref:glycosyl hydrolase family 95 catalytic domain-containing protein n=1 Tax=Foetidibacter luteolus TaxID=2608880 RepID=UPI00129B5686|nr:glycoside hydrolase N-terminal domain-containing protein [Foetidibacter luteolus]
MKKQLLHVLLTLLALHAQAQQPEHNLRFDSLASSWDEAIPLGNATLGVLIWQKDGRVRFSLDRSDLWDQRPMKGLHRKEFSYQWVQQQVAKKEYKPVQEYLDAPYDREPAPTKIPGSALEFNLQNPGQVQFAELHLATALCRVKWSSGILLTSFVHATRPAGWFRFENVTGNFLPQLVPPKYQGAVTVSGDPVGGDDLSRLGYSNGTLTKQTNSITYRQQGWSGFSYEISVRWKNNGHTIEGTWSISSHVAGKASATASAVTQKSLVTGYNNAYTSHSSWWKNFWSKSAIHVPNDTIEKQWYLEQYKFGSASRKGAPPISLQAVWTADNGRIPPWKGDYHHDLNTQLSYWPSYSANHLDEGMAYLDHLDGNKANYKRYTKLYFGVNGLAVPGVTTLDGTEMGGWIQYSLSPTVSCWLAQHFYLQWRYSMNRGFLQQRAYPWIKETASFIENITRLNADGYRQLPISSSPEINNNSLQAWFTQNTNYDLALMKFVFNAAAELAIELGLNKEAAHWKKTESQFADFAVTPQQQLMFAPTLPYNQSHRHFSHAMAIHPLGLIKWEDGPQAQAIISNTIRLLDSIGPSAWCGYSYAWLANLKARAKDGRGALTALQVFAKAFCSPNSFHLNGDQTKSGYSSFQYRPFTLEGNFAFAAGLQEMLLQSYAGFIEIMPAIPVEWKDVSFNQLRAEGALLVSAKKTNGQIKEVKIIAEKAGTTKLKLPFQQYTVTQQNKVTANTAEDGFITLTCQPGAVIVLQRQ